MTSITALTAARTGGASRSWGAARVYVVLGKLSKTTKDAVERVTGKKILSRQNGNRPALYWGYDNATGIEYWQADRFAKSLESNGVSAYVDADED